MIFASFPTAWPGDPYFRLVGSRGLENTGAAASVIPIVSTIEMRNFSSNALWSAGGRADDADLPKRTDQRVPFALYFGAGNQVRNDGRHDGDHEHR